MLEAMRAVVCAALLTCFAVAQNTTPDQLFRSAVEAQQRGDFGLAIRDYQRLLQLQPGSVEVLANVGAALAHENRFDEAIADYQAALKLDAGNAAIQLNLGLAFYKKGDLQNAISQFELLRKTEPDNARVATLLGDSYLRLAQTEKTVALLTPLEAAHPEDLDLAYVLGSALIASGKERDGLVLVERVAKRVNSADAYMLAAKTRLKLNDFGAASEDLEAAARIDPHLPDLYTLLGIAKEGAGDLEGAEKDLRAALELNRNDFQANMHLGGILYEKRDLDGAKTYIQRALDITPDSLFALYELALVKGATGQVDAAVSDLEKIVQRDPNWLDAHVQLAALYYKQHRQADGLKERQIVDRLTAEQQKKGPSQNPHSIESARPSSIRRVLQLRKLRRSSPRVQTQTGVFPVRSASGDGTSSQLLEGYLPL